MSARILRSWARASGKIPSAMGLMLALSLLSGAVVLRRDRAEEGGGLTIWTFGRSHALLYAPIGAASEPPVRVELLDHRAMERRVLSGIFAGIPLAEMVEVERSLAFRLFSGPPEGVGLRDLTERLRASGLMEQLNPPSLSPWTSRGRIYGLPHDVHPVLLAYRADLTEGIEMEAVETWEDFFEATRPLIQDLDGDGRMDRYPLALWETSTHLIELLLLQAGGRLFDEEERPVLDSPPNPAVIATLASWMVGPNRVASEAPEFSAAGNALRRDGLVVASLVPDWMCAVWKQDLPELRGKVKLMPLPAWERVGRRTSVWGGTMMGFPAGGRDFERAWGFATRLYFSPELARALYTESDIVTPARPLWSDPVFDTPDPYFSGQQKGRMYLELAPDVPPRTASPFNAIAAARLQDALITLRRYANERQLYGARDLEPEARRLLGEAQREVERQMGRSAFHRQAP